MHFRIPFFLAFVYLFQFQMRKNIEGPQPGWNIVKILETISG